ncbi:MAG: hypothetical protein ACRD0A_16910 [Acidimicrobiales bacterium]
MKTVRVLVGMVVVALLVVVVDALSDATQNRPDAIVAGSRSTVVYDIELRDQRRNEAAAAATLWSVCAGTVTHATLRSGPAASMAGWSVTVEPALGENSRRRLVGCLEDTTIDGVLARVVDLTPHPR